MQTAPGTDPTTLSRSRLPILGWAMVLGSVVYTAYVHHGLGGTEFGQTTHVWQPTGFLRETEWVDELLEHWGLGILIFSAPAGVALGIIAFTTRSSVARTIGTCGLTCVALMAFYGLSPALRVWEFFHWRASAVILATGVALGCTLTSPLLARRLLDLRPRSQALLYFPVFIAVASIIRNATGSDETLFLNFSPWPAIPVLGLEIAGYGITGILFGLALGLAGAGLARSRSWLRAISFTLGALFPLVWFKARFPRTEFSIDVSILAISALCMFLFSLGQAPDRGRKRLQRATYFFLGASMVAAPLFFGRALADGDYAITRHVRAQAIIDALDAFYQEESAYPEDLKELVEGSYIDNLPEPRIGFEIYYAVGGLKKPQFEYRNLGPSYVLEFSSTAWVMCSYNPPWILDEDEDPEDFSDPEDLLGAWNCPNDRPDLW
jgi:hypothetical protein